MAMRLEQVILFSLDFLFAFLLANNEGLEKLYGGRLKSMIAFLSNFFSKFAAITASIFGLLVVLSYVYADNEWYDVILIIVAGIGCGYGSIYVFGGILSMICPSYFNSFEDEEEDYKCDNKDENSEEVKIKKEKLETKRMEYIATDVLIRLIAAIGSVVVAYYMIF